MKSNKESEGGEDSDFLLSVDDILKIQEERQETLKKNAVMRERLEVKITELKLRRMFRENIQYLKDIEAGRVES